MGVCIPSLYVLHLHPERYAQYAMNPDPIPRGTLPPQGDTGNGWKDAMESISQVMPHVKFILPSAQQQPVTLNGGRPPPQPP